MRRVGGFGSMDQAKPTILVVEDEALLRMYAADMLEENGFGVVEAANADAAVKVLETRDDVRLLFTDVRMQARGRDGPSAKGSPLGGPTFFWSSLQGTRGPLRPKFPITATSSPSRTERTNCLAK